MPGAFTFVKKDIFIKVGGANTKALIDDFELTVTLQRYIYEHKNEGDLSIAFVPDFRLLYRSSGDYKVF